MYIWIYIYIYICFISLVLMAKRQVALFGTLVRPEPLIKNTNTRNNSVYKQVANKFWALDAHKGFTKQVGQSREDATPL